MASNKYARGNVVTITAGGTLTAGDPITVGDCVGVVLKDAVSGDEVAVAIEETWTLAKVSGSAWNPGDSLTWDDNVSAFDLDSNVTPATGDVVRAAVAGAAAASGDTTGAVKLTPGAGTVQ